MDRHLFLQHLQNLDNAANRTQPLAKLEGNFNALVALMDLQKAAKQILADIESLLDPEVK